MLYYKATAGCGVGFLWGSRCASTPPPLLSSWRYRVAQVRSTHESPVAQGTHPPHGHARRHAARARHCTDNKVTKRSKNEKEEYGMR